MTELKIRLKASFYRWLENNTLTECSVHPFRGFFPRNYFPLIIHDVRDLNANGGKRTKSIETALEAENEPIIILTRNALSI